MRKLPSYYHLEHLAHVDKIWHRTGRVSLVVEISAALTLTVSDKWLALNSVGGHEFKNAFHGWLLVTSENRGKVLITSFYSCKVCVTCKTNRGWQGKSLILTQTLLLFFFKISDIMYYLVSSIEYCAHQISVSANPSYKDVYFSVSQFVSLHNSRYCIVQKELRTPHGDSCNIGITTDPKTICILLQIV